MEIKHLILYARRHNWSLIGPGDWVESEWKIYSDGSYTQSDKYNPTWEQLEETTSWSIKKREYIFSGKLRVNALSELTALITTTWRDPELRITACDGESWQIEAYSDNGTVINSSGKLDYIYGEKNLEHIASLMPKRNKHANPRGAYISVDK